MLKKVAVVQWSAVDEIAPAICSSLVGLGYEPVIFHFDAAIPRDVGIVFSFAPYGRFAPICHQLQKMNARQRPFLIHWNTENPPDLRLPWLLMYPLAYLRAWIDRLQDDQHAFAQSLAHTRIMTSVNRRMHKFRYLGEYHYAYRQGVLNLLVESSVVYAHLHQQHGLPTLCVPWGSINGWYADLGLVRDIEVLWIGNRRSARRSHNIDRIRQELKQRGVRMHVVDDVENPFVFGEERLHLLNRSTITLNLLPTWYDHAFPYRFHLAAPNRSLVVSEPIPPHSPRYQAGVHFVSAAVENLTSSICTYLDDETQRRQIVDEAFRLTTQEMTFGNSIKTIMDECDRLQQSTR
jgi:hypothetical protein